LSADCIAGSVSDGEALGRDRQAWIRAAAAKETFTLPLRKESFMSTTLTIIVVVLVVVLLFLLNMRRSSR